MFWVCAVKQSFRGKGGRKVVCFSIAKASFVKASQSPNNNNRESLELKYACRIIHSLLVLILSLTLWSTFDSTSLVVKGPSCIYDPSRSSKIRANRMIIELSRLNPERAACHKRWCIHNFLQSKAGCCFDADTQHQQLHILRSTGTCLKHAPFNCSSPIHPTHTIEHVKVVQDLGEPDNI